MSKLKFHIVIVLSLLLFYAQAQNTKQAKKTLRKVHLQLKWKHQFQFAGYYAAVEKGFYRDAGLDVVLLEASDSEDPTDAVVDSRVEFGTSTSDIILLRNQGKPLVLLSPIFQHSPQVIVATKQSGIKYVHDLAGKRIMIEPRATALEAYLSNEGISLSQLHVLPHSFNINKIIEGKADAASAYITDEPFALQQAGVDYTIISPVAGGIDFYGDVLYTSERIVRSDPELARRFLEASLKGWEYAMKHTEELVEIIYTKYSTRHSRAHLQFEADAMQKLLLPEVVKIGYSNLGRWEKIAQVYAEQGLIGDDVSLDGLFFESYLEKNEEAFPVELFAIVLLIFVGVGSPGYFFYRLSRKLANEVEKRKQIETIFRTNEKELREINKTKDKFFSIIAHDLRSPFNALIGLSELHLNDYESFDEGDHLLFLKLLNDQLKNTFNLLENILTWSRSQQNKIKFSPKQLEVRSHIEQICETYSGAADKKNVRIVCNVPENVVVYADEDMLELVFRNLISNAIKYSHEGGNVYVGFEKSEQEENLFFVRDQGVGIPKDRLEKLFALEANMSTPGTQDESGTGLGLVLCKDFIEQHKGKIWAKSQIGLGAVFYFSIPFASSE